jgi:hypothetical protein
LDESERSKVLKVEYLAEHDCHLFCGNDVGSSSSSNSSGDAGGSSSNNNKPTYTSVNKLLREKYPDDSVLAPSERVLDREKLVADLTSDDEATWAPYAGCFVSIRGGKETSRDAFAANTGLCFQRAPPSRSGTGRELGPYARKICAWTVGETDADSYLRKRSSVPLTLARRSFPSDGQVSTMSVEYFRFLVRERGLQGFELVHLIVYQRRFWNREFMWNDVLVRRHELVKAGLRDSLEAATCKLFGNALFG